MANVLATFAQFERRLISQRTREALAVKRAQGVRLGRPRTMDEKIVRRIRRERRKGRSTSITGGSTLRRSLAALLHDSRGFRGVPRNPAKPGHFSNYGLTPTQDTDLSEWMRERLLLACWPKPLECEEALGVIEGAV